MTARALLVVAAVLALVEYLTLSLLFDARELLPAALVGVGAWAPLPLVVVAASLILRASHASAATAVADASDPTAMPRHSLARAAGIVVAQLACFAALLAVSAAQRDAPVESRALVWGALAASSAALLVWLALGGAPLAPLAQRLAGPLTLGGAVGVLAWLAGRGTGELWHPLARATLLPIAAVVRALSADAIVDVEDFVVGTARFLVRIEPICSGYEGMGLVAVLVGAYVWVFRAALRMPHALVLPVIAAALAFVANIVRIMALIYVGSLVSPDVAMGGFHSKAGWILFSAIALGVVALARRSAWLRDASTTPTNGAPDNATFENPSAPYLAPLLAFTACSLFVGLVADGGLGHLEIAAALGAAGALLWHRAAIKDALRGEGARTPHAARLAIAAGALIGVGWLVLTRADADADAAAHARHAALGPTAAALRVVTRLVVSMAVVPLVEELGFRGFLLRRVVAADFARLPYADVTPLAIVTSSLAFGLLHANVLAGALAGVVLALLVAVTGRLRDAVIAHAVANAILAAAVVGLDRWSLWP